MKRVGLIPLCVLLLSLLISACVSSDDKEFKSLITQAEEHESNFEYQSAIDVYKKALEIKEEPSARTKLNKLNADLVEIRDVTEIVNKLRSTTGSYSSIVSAGDLLDLCDELTDQISKLEAFDTSSGSRAAVYLKNLKEDNGYFSFTSSVETARIFQLAGGGGHDPFTDALKINEALNALLDGNPIPKSFLSVK